jgi:large subunit ribosomal protein L18
MSGCVGRKKTPATKPPTAESPHSRVPSLGEKGKIMDRAKLRVASRGRIRQRIRNKVSGTEQRPRLAVFKSLKHIYAQVIDDASGNTIISASTREKDANAKGANAASCKAVGALIAKKAKDKGITRVVFDRGGYLYHGNIKALADAARENGLEF